MEIFNFSDPIEVLGYVASAFLLWSVTINVPQKPMMFRLLNLTGCILFAVYGFTRPATSVGVINTILALMNIYHIFMMLKSKK